MAARKFRFRLVPAVITALMVAVLLGLGCWQLERLEWKRGVLAHMDAQMAAKPVPLPETVADAKTWEYRRVSMAGQYLFDREFMVGPRTLDGKAGYHMVVPFRRASGGIVFVNRGWISDALRKKADRPEGIVQVEGIVQLPVKHSYTPDNAPDKKQWYWIDVKEMAGAAKLENPLPLVVATPEAPKGVYPAGGAVIVNIPNDHQKYAYFWFSMALAAIAVYILSQLQPATLEEKHAGV